MGRRYKDEHALEDSDAGPEVGENLQGLANREAEEKRSSERAEGKRVRVGRETVCAGGDGEGDQGNVARQKRE